MVGAVLGHHIFLNPIKQRILRNSKDKELRYKFVKQLLRFLNDLFGLNENINQEL